MSIQLLESTDLCKYRVTIYLPYYEDDEEMNSVNIIVDSSSEFCARKMGDNYIRRMLHSSNRNVWSGANVISVEEIDDGDELEIIQEKTASNREISVHSDSGKIFFGDISHALDRETLADAENNGPGISNFGDIEYGYCEIDNLYDGIESDSNSKYKFNTDMIGLVPIEAWGNITSAQLKSYGKVINSREATMIYSGNIIEVISDSFYETIYINNEDEVGSDEE